MLGNFQQQLVEAFEPTQAAPFLHEAGEESAPFFGVRAIAIQCEIKPALEEVFEHEARDFGIDDGGRLSDSPTREKVSRSEARFSYDYDAHGNWVMKTIEGRGEPDRDFALSSIERRTIGYFAGSVS